MTDKEIIRALRLCSCETSTRNCPTCPLSGNDDCVTDALREAADIIERLTAENAALREGASLGKVKRSQKQAYEKQIESLQALANRQLSEIKKLQKDLCWKDLEVDAAEWKQERAEAERDALREKVPQWVSVANRLPELWKNEKTGELINYMVRSPYFGVDIGNYQKEAGTWLCMGLPCTVTHWMPLPEAPEEVLPKNMADEIALKLMRLADLEAICSFARLRELAEADKDGRVLILPCAPDAIYWEKVGGILAQSRFEGLHVYEDGTIKYAGYGMEICAEDIGKTVFLTREEAEKALQEMEGKKDGNKTSM